MKQQQQTHQVSEHLHLLRGHDVVRPLLGQAQPEAQLRHAAAQADVQPLVRLASQAPRAQALEQVHAQRELGGAAGVILEERLDGAPRRARSEEHTSELQSLMRISYAVFCLKKKKNKIKTHTP